MSVIKKVLSLCNLNPEKKQTFDAVKLIGDRIECLSCKSAIIMSFQSIVRIDGY
jgi:hypothetical protein